MRIAAILQSHLTRIKQGYIEYLSSTIFKILCIKDFASNPLSVRLTEPLLVIVILKENFMGVTAVEVKPPQN